MNPTRVQRHLFDLDAHEVFVAREEDIRSALLVLLFVIQSRLLVTFNATPQAVLLRTTPSPGSNVLAVQNACDQVLFKFSTFTA